MEGVELVRYYAEQAEACWRKAGKLFRTSERLIAPQLGREAAVSVTGETEVAFKALARELPDIGGDGNLFTPTLVGSMLALAYLQTLERNGYSRDEAGKALYEVYYETFASLPSPLRWVLRRREFSGSHMAKLREAAETSQRREYPYNWVFTHVEGNGKDLDFGDDYAECAVFKLLAGRGRGEEVYMPYLCVLDLAYSRAIDSGLTRTGTVYWGAPCCDFRYFEGRESPATTSYEDLPEYRNRKAP